MASTGNAVDLNPCHLLQIPKELRFIIYRQLLFPTSLVPMIPLSPLDLDEPGNSSEEEWIDESEDGTSTSSMESELEEMMYGGSTRTYITGAEAAAEMAAEAGYSSTREQYESLKRFPAILRTNRQIHEEATSLLYSEAILVIEPGDIFCLRKKPKDLPFGARNPNPWRHNPLKGLGKLENGKVTYDTPEIDGHMEPHIFSRFQKIYFSAVFDIEHTEHVEMWIDHNTHIIPGDDIRAYQQLLNQSHLMKDFVKVLSRSPRIQRLEICLEVEIMASSELLLEDVPEDLDDEEVDERDEKADRLMDIASEKATELLLDSKICEPLLKLSNVKTFEFKTGFETRKEDELEVYIPPRKYVDMFQMMKTKVEGNFKESGKI